MGRRRLLACLETLEHVAGAKGSAGIGSVVIAEPAKTITSAKFDVPAGIRYLRAEVIDPQGRHAWTNPIAFCNKGP